MSRESVRWTPATRDFLKKRFQQAQEEATGIIEKELQEKDFLKWVESCRNLTLYAGNRNSVINRLSKIVDINSLKPKFSGSTDAIIKFDYVNSLFEGFSIKVFTKYLDKKENKYKVNREESNTWSSLPMDSFYLKEHVTQRTKDIYLCDQNNGKFSIITPLSDKEIEAEVNVLCSQNKITRANAPKVIASRLSYRDKVLKLIQESELYKNYDLLEVPEDYLKNLDKVENKIEEEEKERQLTPEEKRKLEERIVAHTLTSRYNVYSTSDGQTYQNKKVEPKIKEVNEYGGNLYYGFQEDLSKLHFAAHILDFQLSKIQHETFYGPKYQLMSISKSNKKNFKDKTHIDDFFGKSIPVTDENGKIKGSTIMFDNAVTLWNTARKVQPLLEDLRFLKNFSIFNEEMSDLYKEITNYVSNYYTPLSTYRGRFGMNDHYEDFIDFLDKIEELQVFCEEEIDDEKIKEKVSEIVLRKGKLPESTLGGIAVDRDIILKTEKLLEYANPVKDLLNYIPMLKEPGEVIPLETSMLLKEFLAFKNR